MLVAPAAEFITINCTGLGLDHVPPADFHCQVPLATLPRAVVMVSFSVPCVNDPP